MGCVSSNLLNRDDEFTQFGSTALGHHIVSLTSTIYGLLTLDPPSQSSTTPPSPHPSSNTGPTFTESKSLSSEPRPVPSRPEIINSWELMSGLDADSFRFCPIPNPAINGSVPKPPVSRSSLLDKFQADSFRFPTTLTLQPEKENADPNLNQNDTVTKIPFSRSSPLPEKKHADPNLNQNDTVTKTPFSRSSPLQKYDPRTDAASKSSPLDKFENLCPPNGENRVVIYTTTLRGIRKTFEDCSAVRSAVESYGIVICERDISMDRGFKEELRELMKGSKQPTPPQVFIKGRYVGGAEEVMRMVDDGRFGDLIKGLPKKKAGEVCDGCGDVKFMPCFACNGSCKVAVAEEKGRKAVVVRCADCNENGLVLCPICS